MVVFCVVHGVGGTGFVVFATSHGVGGTGFVVFATAGLAFATWPMAIATTSTRSTRAMSLDHLSMLGLQGAFAPVPSIDLSGQS